MLHCSQSDALTSWEKVTNFVVFIAMFHKPMATTTHNPQPTSASCEKLWDSLCPYTFSNETNILWNFYWQNYYWSNFLKLEERKLKFRTFFSFLIFIILSYMKIENWNLPNKEKRKKKKENKKYIYIYIYPVWYINKSKEKRKGKDKPRKKHGSLKPKL